MSIINEQVKELRGISENKDGNIRVISGVIEDLYKMLEQAADTIESLSAKLQAENMERSDRYYGGGWIACEDRLPEKSGEYIATDELGCSTALYYEKEENEWVDIIEHYSIFYPTAWQPLPKPYRP